MGVRRYIQAILYSTIIFTFLLNGSCVAYRANNLAEISAPQPSDSPKTNRLFLDYSTTVNNSTSDWPEFRSGYKKDLVLDILQGAKLSRLITSSSPIGMENGDYALKLRADLKNPETTSKLLSVFTLMVLPGFQDFPWTVEAELLNHKSQILWAHTYGDKYTILYWLPVIPAGLLGINTPHKVCENVFENILYHVVADLQNSGSFSDSAVMMQPQNREQAFSEAEVAKVLGYNSPAAIMNFSAHDGVTQGAAAVLTDRFAIELDQLNAYQLINRGKMKEILELQEFSTSEACDSSKCVLEAGRILGVRYMISGSIGRVGSIFTINSQLTDVESGVTQATSTTDVPGELEEVLTSGMKVSAQRLLRAAIK